MTRLFFAFLFICGVSNALFATHIVGGELTYRCLGNNQYEIKLSVYRDCFNGVPPFDDPASVAIYNDAYDVPPVEALLLPVSAIDDTLDIYLDNPCLTIPPDICVHRTTYTAIVSLPPIPGGYNIVYQRCCRNKLIRNIITPEDVGITIIAEINDLALATCNQGAYYNNWPPLAICVNEPINFDHSATDLDQDSLVYRLCTPLAGGTEMIPQPVPANPGPYAEVVWNNPYNLSDLLGGIPLAINPNTGLITGTPNLVGNFVVGVCVDEYRGDSVISTTRRDFQYNVADCGQSLAAFFAPKLLCDSKEVQFTNQSAFHPLNTYDWYFDWNGDQSLQSTAFEPSFVYPDTGRYTVALILNGSYVCRDTFFQEIWVTQPTVNLSVNTNYLNCDSTGVLVTFSNESTDPQYGIDKYAWSFLGPNNWTYTTDEEDPEFRVFAAGNYTAVLTVTGGNGCTTQRTIPFTVPIPPIETFLDQYIICPGESIGLFPGADPSFIYNWSPSSAFTNNTLPNPIVAPIENNTYMVTITDAFNICTVIRTVNVIVLDAGVLTATATPPVIYLGESSQLLATFPNALEFVWTPAGSLSNPNIPNPIATPTDSTTYTVQVKTTGNCGPITTVRVLVLTPRCEEPFMFFPTAFSPNGDGENDILKMEGRLAEEVYWVVYNRWGERMYEAFDINDAWDGTYKGVEQPAETYGYYYRIRCAGNEVREKKGNVTLIR